MGRGAVFVVCVYVLAEIEERRRFGEERRIPGKGKGEHVSARFRGHNGFPKLSLLVSRRGGRVLMGDETWWNNTISISLTSLPLRLHQIQIVDYQPPLECYSSSEVNLKFYIQRG